MHLSSNDFSVISTEVPVLAFARKHTHSCHFDRSNGTPPSVIPTEVHRRWTKRRDLANDLNEPTRIHASSHLLIHAFSFSSFLHFFLKNLLKYGRVVIQIHCEVFFTVLCEYGPFFCRKSAQNGILGDWRTKR